MEENIRSNNRSLVVTVLSLSLLTVMAGAAIAPALDVIQAHFANQSQFLVQMIVSIPALFIVIGNLIFPRLTQSFTVRTLCLVGLFLYVIGGVSAGLFNNIYVILVMRAFVGLGVGVLMPLSTGLISFYFPPSQLHKLMGYSSAMNQMGGVIATLLAGILSGISWRLSFLVYLMGLFSLVLCLLFLPKDRLVGNGNRESSNGDGIADGSHDSQIPKLQETIKEYWANIVAMFLLMTSFFIYATNFAMISIADGFIPHSAISIIMAGMDFVAFIGGLFFARFKKVRFLAPTLFLLGYLALAFIGGWIGTIVGSIFVGFANGVGIPYIISNGSEREGRRAVTTIIPLLSMALYVAQFVNPAITSLCKGVLCNGVHAPYYLACVTSVLFLVVSGFIKNTDSR